MTRVETSWGQKEISGKNGFGRNDPDFRREDSNVFYPLQNQLKANALIDRRCISQTLICDYGNYCRISSMYLDASYYINFAKHLNSVLYIIVA